MIDDEHRVGGLRAHGVEDLRRGHAHPRDRAAVGQGRTLHEREDAEVTVLERGQLEGRDAEEVVLQAFAGDEIGPIVDPLVIGATGDLQTVTGGAAQLELGAIGRVRGAARVDVIVGTHHARGVDHARERRVDAHGLSCGDGDDLVEAELVLHPARHGHAVTTHRHAQRRGRWPRENLVQAARGRRGLAPP